MAASQAYLQAVIKERADKNPTILSSFNPGDYVLVDYPERPPDKLTPQWKGPLVVIEPHPTLKQTYLCQDMLSMKITPYHIERLNLFKVDPLEKPADIAAADKDLYLVEKIVAHKGKVSKKQQMEFRVRWLGYPDPADDTWLPWREVRMLEALAEYVNGNPKLSSLVPRSK